MGQFIKALVFGALTMIGAYLIASELDWSWRGQYGLYFLVLSIAMSIDLFGHRHV